MTPLVSIVIPSYNRARDLERALKSVVAQTHSHWEAIIVDNHSSDNTDEVVRGFKDARIQLLKIHNDGVIAASRNAGIRHAKGLYVAFLDADDWWMPRKLQESLRHLEQGADVVHHDLYYSTKYDQKLFLTWTHSRQLKPPAAGDLILNGNALANSSVVVQKRVLDQVGGLCEDREVVTWEDYDLWIRIAKVTDNITFMTKRLGYCWRGGGNALTTARALTQITAFEKRYLPAKASGPGAERAWVMYGKGRCYYLLQQYDVAIPLFARLVARPSPARIKWRALVLLVTAAIRRRLGASLKSTT